MDKENCSGVSRGGRPLDEFDVYFARAALDASRDETDGGDCAPLGDLSPSGSLRLLVYREDDEPHRKTASTPRRSVSCKYPSRKKSVSPKRDSTPGGSPLVVGGPHSPKASTAGVGDAGLCAPLLGVWTSNRSSSSAPQSRSSSWRKMKRPRSFRDSDHHHHHGGGKSESPAATGTNLEDAIFDRLQQLKLMKEADCCVVRSFNTSAKGNIVDKFDMFKRISSVQLPPPSSASPSPALTSPLGSDVTNVDPDRHRKTGSRSEETGNGTTVPCGRTGTSDVCKVVVIGQSHVGKTALIQQFMTSHYMAAVCTSFDDEADKTVCVILNGEETTINFIDSGAPTKQEYLEYVGRSDVDAYLLVYSITALASFRYACEVLCDIRCAECPADRLLHLHQPAIILVANKSDLVRTKQVSETEAKYVCQWLDCKYIAVSASLNHRVDDLLVGIVRQIKRNRRTKVEGGHFGGCADAGTDGANQRCLKGAKEILKELFRGDLCVPPSSSCDDLYEL